MLGQPVVHNLVEKGYRVRLLMRSVEKVGKMFDDTVEIIAGSAVNKDDMNNALAGCDAAHINLTQDSEQPAVQHIVDLAAGHNLERITYVSATTASEENRWFPLTASKLRTEELLRQSSIPHVVFCPSWAMETLLNFVNDNRGVIIIGKNPPPLHFFAAFDFGRIVAASYADDRALGKRLFIHGPEGITLPVALERFFATCHPKINITRYPLWQTRLIAKLTRRKGLAGVTNLIEYFDKVGEPGDPTETNALFGAPTTTLDDWFKLPIDH
jgi:uncharacterized protein YbjT (DUF2867 family)